MMFGTKIIAMETVEKVSGSRCILTLEPTGFVDEADVGCVRCWGVKDDSTIFSLSNWAYYFLTWGKLWKNKFGGGSSDGGQELSLGYAKFDTSINWWQ